MAIFHLRWDEVAPPACRGGALTIGNFDGVHRGHQALLAELKRQARAAAGPAVALTFDPHPLVLLRPEQFQPLLTTVAERAASMLAYGADHVVVLGTSPALLHLRAREFFDRVVRSGLDARAMVEGYNFGFGHNREGTMPMLEALCRDAGMSLTLVPPVAWEGRPISSSRVRDELLRGNVKEAAVLMNRPYRLAGVVAHGQHRGATLGFPTANLENVATLIPGNGVYAVRVTHDGQTWPGAANVGPNPTFGEQARKLEVHLIGFQGDLYGQTLSVDFVERLRETRPFRDAAELTAQLRLDVETATKLLSN